MNYLLRLFLAVCLLGFPCSALYAQPGETLPSADSQNVLPTRDNATEALFYDAIKQRIAGNNAEAEGMLKEYVKRRPEVSAAWYDLARLAMKDQRLDEAKGYILKALKIDAKNKWYREQYANILALQKQYGDAADLFMELAASEHFVDDYLSSAVLLYRQDGQLKKAMDALHTLMKRVGSDDEELMMQEEDLYLKMNDVDNAAAVIRRLYNLDPGSPRYLSLLAQVYENNKQQDKAKQVIAEMQQRFPDDPMVQLSLAEQYRKSGDTGNYERLVVRAITNKDLDVEDQITLLAAYADDIKNNPAKQSQLLQLADSLVRIHPADSRVHAVYGDLLLMNNQVTKAAGEYERSLQLDQSKFSSWQQLLAAYSGKEYADSLIYWSEKAARLFPNQAMVHYFNGIGHYNKGENDKAVKALGRAVDLQPDESVADQQLLASMYAMLGDVYNAGSQFENSDSSFEKAIQLDPRNATVLNNYAYYLSVRNVRLDDAARMSRHSLELRPGEATFLDTYGWILYRQGKYSDAKKYITDAITNTPNPDGTLWEHLGDVEFRLGNVDEAVKDWNNAKQKGVDNMTRLEKKITDRNIYE